ARRVVPRHSQRPDGLGARQLPDRFRRQDGGDARPVADKPAPRSALPPRPQTAVKAPSAKDLPPMKTTRLAATLAFGALSLLPLTGAAMAASAYASDKISIFAEPRNRANEIVGMLQAGETVTIDRCTASGNWCR